MSAGESSRAGARIKVLLAGSVSFDGQVVPIRVRNISRSGIAGDARLPLESGAAVTFVRGATRRSGRVIWTDGQRFGIRFKHPLDEDELRVHLPDGGCSPTNSPKFSMFNWHSDSRSRARPEKGEIDPSLRLVTKCMEVISSDEHLVGFVDDLHESGLSVIPPGEHRSDKLFLAASCISRVGDSVLLCLSAKELEAHVTRAPPSSRESAGGQNKGVG